MILLTPNLTKTLFSLNYPKLFSNFKLNNSTELLHNYLLLGFEYSTTHPLTLGLNNIIKNKYNIDFYSELINKNNNIFLDYSKFLNIYSNILTQIQKTYAKTHPIFLYESTGARATWLQLKQLIGVRGFLTNLSNKNLPVPILKGFNKGLSLFEFILSCYGARKGLVVSSIQTADAGYLTRKLVEQLQNLVIKEFYCSTDKVYKVLFTSNSKGELSTELFQVLIGKTLARNIYNKYTGHLIYKKNIILDYHKILKVLKVNTRHSKFFIFTPGTCLLNNSICKTCFGFVNTENKYIQSKTIGILAAQSIGEPATQSTLRTFHAGGIVKSMFEKKKYFKENITDFFNFYYVNVPNILEKKFTFKLNNVNLVPKGSFDVTKLTQYQENCNFKKTFTNLDVINPFNKSIKLILKYIPPSKSWYLLSTSKEKDTTINSNSEDTIFYKISLNKGFKIKKVSTIIGLYHSNLFELAFFSNKIHKIKYFNKLKKIWMLTYKNNKKMYYFSSFWICSRF